jgi:hypothetical protein
MPRVTKAEYKESIRTFADDSVAVIKEYLNLDENKDSLHCIEKNGWYYTIKKNVQHVNPEIILRRENFKMGKEKEYPKGNRIEERAFIYKEGMNCEIINIYGLDDYEHAPDHGYLLDGFSIQDYVRFRF